MHGDEGEPIGMADALMGRGERLRMLRLMAEEDERERNDTGEAVENASSRGDLCNHSKHAGGEDRFECLPTGAKILRYDSYLRHQRYYDDLKHINYQYIDYGIIGGGGVIIEQRKALGKGGIAWDAAFILGEHMVANEKTWRAGASTSYGARPRLLELGAGTGLTSFMIAKACRASVTATDLPELLDLMRSNLELNFVSKSDGNNKNGDEEKACTSTYIHRKFPDYEGSMGSASVKVLRWGKRVDYIGAPYDVIFGADVVASLYDPVALAKTFYELAGPNTKVYLSYKGRLDEPHQLFEAEFKKLFAKVCRVRPNTSRNRNPDVWIFEGEGKC